MRLKLGSLVAVLALLVLPGAVFADTIGFTGGNGSTGTGSVSYTAAIGNSFNVTGAEIDSLSINGTSYSVTGGLMNLVSGPTLINSGCIGSGCFAIFDGGGSLTVTGDLGSGSVTLLSSSYLANGFLGYLGSTGVYSALLDPASIALNPAILSLLGGTNITSGSNTVIDLSLGFSDGIYSASNAVTNSGVTITTVPEPATIGLLAFGLIAMAGFRKKILVASV